MKNNLLIASSLILTCTNLNSANKSEISQERPNILWLTFEDTSYYEFGCYGNKQVSTPNIDSLAANGIQYMNAWSVAPQSSPARSSLITGCYATTFGMDIHHVKQQTPENIFFPQFLRDAGYYCINNRKTHYNTQNDHTACWDECDKKASYNSQKRDNGQPFFAVYNTVTSHMGRVRTFHTDGRRDYSTEGIYINELQLPPHVPDLPAVRSDYAGHLEAAQDVDTWVGFFLKDLKEKGLDENTIIFVFSDHGGCLPRGKGYVYETGLHVPLVVYFPPKWEHLANGKIKTKETELISFVDLGPTVLSLTEIETPAYMHGKAKTGKFAHTEKTDYQFAFGANQLHHYMPMRAATDGRYKYIRSYIPYMQYACRNYYQWGMPSNMSWDDLVIKQKNGTPTLSQPFLIHPTEMLFDLENDPFELNNLADDSKHETTLLRFRETMSNHIRETADLGFFIPSFRKNRNIYDLAHNEHYPLNELLDLVELASLPGKHDTAALKKYLQHDCPNFRFWAAVGFANLAMNKKTDNCPQELLVLLSDKNEHVAAEAAFACVFSSETEKGMEALMTSKNTHLGKAALSRLESVSLHESKRKYLYPYINKLKEMAENLPAESNEDLGLMAKGILVNLGEIEIFDLYGAGAYEEGLKLNRGRRPMIPQP